MQIESEGVQQNPRRFGTEITNQPQSYKGRTMEVESYKNQPKVGAIRQIPPVDELFNMLPVDLDENDVPENVACYAKEIYDNLHLQSKNYLPAHGYMEKQSDINDRMRAILNDWLVDVHSKFKLVDETLFLTINLIDRYLEKEQVSRQKLQLVGVTCCFIASKYEEIYPPDLRDFVHVTDKAYTKQEILQMEGKILTALSFNITISSQLLYLHRYAKLMGVPYNSKRYHLARYLMELALIEYNMLRFDNRNIAASALITTGQIFNHKF